jgi:hypothetical protein
VRNVSLAAHIVQILRDVIGRRREIHGVNVFEESAIWASSYCVRVRVIESDPSATR